ncbi:MAG: hypothetical protein ABJA74_13615 [Lapillicoccus sp.]
MPLAMAARSDGWREVVEQVVADDGLNVNRRGVVFVPVMANRDLAALAMRVATCSREVYLCLLDDA